MEKFSYLLRKRNKALGLFKKVTSRLAKLERQISDVIKSSNQEIDNAKKTIDEHTVAVEYLNGELAKTQLSRENVEKLYS